MLRCDATESILFFWIDNNISHPGTTEALSERDDLEYQIIELRRQVNDLQNQLDSKDAEW